MSTTQITVLIVEDDPVIAADLTFFMKDFGYSPYPSVSNASDALLLLNNVQPDFILIDVTLEGEKDGIELATEINKKHDLPLVFLTAHHDRNTIDRIKATRPSAYLVKPLQEHNLQTSIELALYNHSHKKMANKDTDSTGEDFVSGEHFFIKVKNQLKKILLDDIMVLEAYDNYSFLHSSDQKHLIGSTLKSLEQKLGDHDFIRIHRSYMINLKAIEGIEEDVVLINKMHLPIGKTYKDDFMKQIQLL